ncbi:MAG: NAD(+)/NADH kinase [Firmicutes bacterium]|nr:NAD(+)/NADH kinase [Bacillota bacterium]
MKTIGVIVNRNRDKDLRYTRILADSMCNMGVKMLLSSDVAEKLSLHGNSYSHNLVKTKNEKDILKEAQMVICLGGDGTFLKVARMVYKKNLPILGINLGNLGFLTEVEKNDIEDAIDRLMRGDYIIEERMMLEASIIRDGKVIRKDTALNDVVISRGALSRILHLKTYINGEFVDMFPGDGLIISSPTGSTAYSLSAGGPIVEPDIDLIIISPICPHILYSRSIITAGNRMVKAVVDEDYSHKAMVTVDGQKGYEIRGGDVIDIGKSNYTIKLIRVNPRNFFDILRTKIYFRGESLKKHEIQ